MTLAHASGLEFEYILGNHDVALGFGSLRVSIGNSSIWSDPEGKGIPLPKTVVVERIRKAFDVAEAIERLREQFAVSRELAAWQIINSRVYAELGNDEMGLLKSWTPNTDNTGFFH